MFNVYVVYFIAVQHLVVTAQYKTAGIDSKVLTKATKATEATEATDVTEATKATEATETTKTTKDSDVTEATEATETTITTKTTETTEATENSDPTDTTRSQEPYPPEENSEPKLPTTMPPRMKYFLSQLRIMNQNRPVETVPFVPYLDFAPLATKNISKPMTTPHNINRQLINILNIKYRTVPKNHEDRKDPTGISIEEENSSEHFLDLESKPNNHSLFKNLALPNNDSVKVKTVDLKNNTTETKTEGLRNMRKNILTIQNTVNVLLSLCCVALSFFMIYTRIKSKSTRSIVHVLYLQNGIADFFVGIGILSQSPILYLMIAKGRQVSGLTVPVFISYFVTSVAVKMSVFLNCVLGVVRCINIVKPFYRPDRKVLTATILLYMVIWVLIVGLDMYMYTEERKVENQVFLVKSILLKGQPGFSFILLTMNDKQQGGSYLGFHLGNLIQFIIPTAIPTMLCFVLMIVQLYHMPKKRKSKMSATKNPQDKDDKVSKASLTIFLLTCIYVITSGTSIVTWLAVYGRRGYLGSKKQFESLVVGKRTATSWSDLTAIYFYLSTCPLICSTLTPLTLLLRGTGPAFSGVRKMFSKSSSGTAVTTL